MSSISYDIKTQELAKRHGKSINQKSHFKYLMNSKTSRTYRASNHSKENQNESVLFGSEHKFAIKKQQKLKGNEQQYQKVTVPLSQTQGNNSIIQRYIKEPLCNRNITQNKQQVYSNRRMTTDESICQLQFESKVKTDSSQDKKSNQVGCMTDHCYYQKQLEIKLQLIQRQKDQIWRNITDIVKQNMTLKEIVDSFTIDTKTLTNSLTQTETSVTSDFASQSELTMTEVQVLNKNYLSIESQLSQAKNLCIKIIPEQQCYDQTIEVDLKDLILETINLNTVKASRQFELQKEFLIKISNQQLQKYKSYNTKLSKQMTLMALKLEETIKTKQNIKKIYQKQIEQIKGLVKQKQEQFITSILQMKQSLQQTNTNLEAENKYYLQYFEKTKQFINQKQKLYATLLSQSHKTIHNLMIQMKQFQNLAQTNYYKHLITQRSQKNIKFHQQT